MAFLKLLSQYMTYIAAIGLFGLAAFQLSTGNIPMGIQSILGGIAALGLQTTMTKATS